MDQLCKHIINRIYSFKMHMNNNIISEHKTHNTTNDKGVHPSLGLHLLVHLCYNPKLHYPCLPGIRPIHASS